MAIIYYRTERLANKVQVESNNNDKTLPALPRSYCSS